MKFPPNVQAVARIETDREYGHLRICFRPALKSGDSFPRFEPPPGEEPYSRDWDDLRNFEIYSQIDASRIRRNEPGDLEPYCVGLRYNGSVQSLKDADFVRDVFRYVSARLEKDRGREANPPDFGTLCWRIIRSMGIDGIVSCGRHENEVESTGAQSVISRIEVLWCNVREQLVPPKEDVA